MEKMEKLHNEKTQKIEKRIRYLEGWICCSFLSIKETITSFEHGEVMYALLNNDEEKVWDIVSSKSEANELCQAFAISVNLDLDVDSFKKKVVEELKQRLEPLRKFLNH